MASPPPYAAWIPMQPANTEYSSGYKSGYSEVVDVEIAPHRQQTFKQKYLGGLARTLRFFLAISSLILVINVLWLCVAIKEYGIQGGFGTIKEGNCPAVKRVNTWLHLGINVLSTLLLTGSNAFMAAYSGPSRSEVDEAHRRGKFIHIGTLSLANLRRIAKRKGIVVVMLGLSSIPFHLLYNSLVFEDLAVNQYYWAIVTEDYLNGASFNLTDQSYSYYESGFMATTPSAWYPDTTNVTQVMYDYFDDMQQSAVSWERLDNKACINAYSNVFVSERRNLILVSSHENDTNSILRYDDADVDSGEYDENWFICSLGGNDGGNMFCNPQEFAASASNWTVFGFPIEYCLSEKVEDICSLRFSQKIMYVVIAFNALKVLLMIWILWRYDAEHILTSVGDAVSSFLSAEDPTTVQMCLANKRQIRHFWRARGFARPFSRTPPRWGEAVSRKRWVLFFLLMFSSFCFVTFFGIWGFAHVKDRGISLSAAGLWQLGFGSVNQNTMVIYDDAPDAIVMAIVANIPQIFLSVIYIMYMGIMTSMFLAADWSTFAFKPQTVMVSTPVGRQRGTWLLNAPLGWGTALLAMQVLLHWFVSRSLFMVQMTLFDKDGKPVVWVDHTESDPSRISNCGYSPIAIVFSMVAAVILLLSAIVFCWRKFPEGAPPVVSTCSAAISAACHPVQRYEDMRFDDLRWGVDGGFANGIGHCSLMAAEKWDMGLASAPLHGYTYAGTL